MDRTVSCVPGAPRLAESQHSASSRLIHPVFHTRRQGMRPPVNTGRARRRFSDASLGGHQLCEPGRCVQPFKICFLNWKMEYSVDLSSDGGSPRFQLILVECLFCPDRVPRNSFPFLPSCPHSFNPDSSFYVGFHPLPTYFHTVVNDLFKMHPDCVTLRSEPFYISLLLLE